MVFLVLHGNGMSWASALPTAYLPLLPRYCCRSKEHVLTPHSRKQKGRRQKPKWDLCFVLFSFTRDLSLSIPKGYASGAVVDNNVLA